jgi:hypothetical protein
MEGKDARDYIEKMLQRRTKEAAETLEKAKQHAATVGKEPFDLAKLEQLCDTSRDGRLAPLDERRAQFEFTYYVTCPTIMSIAEFAEYVERTNKW